MDDHVRRRQHRQTVAERLRAGGSGLAGFFTPTGYGTELTQGRETRVIDGKGYVYEKALPVDVALVQADRADRYGNLRYRLATRNFNPVMAMAARHTIAQVLRSIACGYLAGTANLYAWVDPIGWVYVGPVGYRVTVVDGGTSVVCNTGKKKSGSCTTTLKPDWFGMDLPLVTLENEGFAQLKGGNVVVK